MTRSVNAVQRTTQDGVRDRLEWKTEQLAQFHMNRSSKNTGGTSTNSRNLAISTIQTKSYEKIKTNRRPVRTARTPPPPPLRLRLQQPLRR